MIATYEVVYQRVLQKNPAKHAETIEAATRATAENTTCSTHGLEGKTVPHHCGSPPSTRR